MPVAYKKMLRKDPRDKNAVAKYYPQLVTQGNSADIDDIAFLMKEASSLSLGDIKSVLTNFTECMRTLLFGGQSVNITDFGVFSLGARTTGTETEKECGVKSIKSVTINFRPSSSIRPSLVSTRAGDRIKFYDVRTGITEETGGGGTDPGGGGGVIDPEA